MFDTRIEAQPVYDYDSNHIQYQIYLLGGKSRGTIKLASAKFEDDPLIDPNYYRDAEDLNVIKRYIISFAKFLLASDVLIRNGVRIVQRQTPCGVMSEDKIISDANFLDCYIKLYTKSGSHSGSSCRMGYRIDPLACVGANLKLLGGVQNVRVVDASVRPTVIRGNRNAATTMIAAKGADMIDVTLRFTFYLILSVIKLIGRRRLIVDMDERLSKISKRLSQKLSKVKGQRLFRSDVCIWIPDEMVQEISANSTLQDRKEMMAIIFITDGQCPEVQMMYDRRWMNPVRYVASSGMAWLTLSQRYVFGQWFVLNYLIGKTIQKCFFHEQSWNAALKFIQASIFTLSSASASASVAMVSKDKPKICFDTFKGQVPTEILELFTKGFELQSSLIRSSKECLPIGTIERFIRLKVDHYQSFIDERPVYMEHVWKKKFACVNNYDIFGCVSSFGFLSLATLLLTGDDEAHLVDKTDLVLITMADACNKLRDLLTHRSSDGFLPFSQYQYLASIEGVNIEADDEEQVAKILLRRMNQQNRQIYEIIQKLRSKPGHEKISTVYHHFQVFLFRLLDIFMKCDRHD